MGALPCREQAAWHRGKVTIERPGGGMPRAENGALGSEATALDGEKWLLLATRSLFNRTCYPGMERRTGGKQRRWLTDMMPAVSTCSAQTHLHVEPRELHAQISINRIVEFCRGLVRHLVSHVPGCFSPGAGKVLSRLNSAGKTKFSHGPA